MSFKESYWKYSLIAIILLFGVTIFNEIRAFMGGILGAITIYILLRKQLFWLLDVRRLRPTLTATLLLLESILFFLIPLSLLVMLLIHMVQGMNIDPQSIMEPINHYAELIKERTGYNIMRSENLNWLIGIVPKVGQFLMNGVSSFVINMLVLLFILYFMLIGGRKMEAYIRDLLPFNRVDKREVIHEIDILVRSNAIGIPLLGIIQGAVALLGYYIFGAPSPILMSILTAVATLIPIIGTAIVWVPMAIYMILSGQVIQSVGLVIYAILIITQIDNVIRFMLQRKLADTHPLITIFGVIIGISLFGFMGVIFGPLLLSLFLLFIDIFKKEYLEGDNKRIFIK